MKDAAAGPYLFLYKKVIKLNYFAENKNGLKGTGRFKYEKPNKLKGEAGMNTTYAGTYDTPHKINWKVLLLSLLISVGSGQVSGLLTNSSMEIYINDVVKPPLSPRARYFQSSGACCLF